MNVVTRVPARSSIASCAGVAAIALSSMASVYASALVSDTTTATNTSAQHPASFADGLLPAANAHRIPAITAVLETRFKPTQNVHEQLRVQLSESGFRFEDVLDGVGMVANYGSDDLSVNAWLMDPVREVVHKIPLNVVEDAPVLPSVEVRLPHYIDSTPCVGGAGHHVDDKWFKNRMVQVWHCTPVRIPETIPAAESTDNNHSALFKSKQFLAAQRSLEAEWPVEQYYDDALNMVVYSINSTGFESELMHIRKKDLHGQTFTPPESYRNVSIEEYLSWELPVVELKDYEF